MAAPGGSPESKEPRLSARLSKSMAAPGGAAIDSISQRVGYSLLPIRLRMLEMMPLRKRRAKTAAMAMSARIRAYSARPWPFVDRRSIDDLLDESAL
jgi:hypothetical protein